MFPRRGRDKDVYSVGRIVQAADRFASTQNSVFVSGRHKHVVVPAVPAYVSDGPPLYLIAAPHTVNLPATKRFVF